MHNTQEKNFYSNMQTLRNYFKLNEIKVAKYLFSWFTVTNELW